MTKAEQQNARLMKRNMALAQYIPKPPRDLKIEGSTISWREPSNVRDITHYLIRSATDVGNVRGKVPVGVTQFAASVGDAKFFVSSWNEASQVESQRQYITSDTGKVGLVYTLHGVTVEILNALDVGISDYGVVIEREADNDEHLFLCPTGMFAYDALGHNRIYLSSKSAGGSYLGLYDDAGLAKASMYVVNDAGRNAELDLGGTAPVLWLQGAGGIVKIGTQQVLAAQQTMDVIGDYFVNSSAGATYTSSEQDIINALIDAVTNVGNWCATLQNKLGLPPYGHGLIAFTTP